MVHIVQQTILILNAHILAQNMINLKSKIEDGSCPRYDQTKRVITGDKIPDCILSTRGFL